jgi:tyrosine phenol-lyase
LDNLRRVKDTASAHNIPPIYDGRLIADNAYFVRQSESGYEDKSTGEIVLEILGCVDLFYISGRNCAKLRGGLIATNEKRLYGALLPWLPVYEGFATYGGIVVEGDRGDGRRPAGDDRPRRGQLIH